MLPRYCILLAATTLSAAAQQLPPSERPIVNYTVHDASRLAALAYLGALTSTTILVEAGPLRYLQAHITLTLKGQRTTVADVARQLLGNAYTFRQKGALLVVHPIDGAPSRLLKIRLGTFDSTGTSISSVYPYLEYRLSQATGCERKGYGWGGPTGEIGLSPFRLTHATLEDVVAAVANARAATMWILPLEPSRPGCIESPLSAAQVGIYGFGENFAGCQQPFSSFFGPNLLGDPLSHPAFPDTCTHTDPLALP